MKCYPLCLFLLIAVVSSFLTSCETTSNNSGSGTRMSRDSGDQWQDRTLRQMAY
ncbi:MAG: hypothetical protein KA152_15325 [Verrucomicrobiales bacterium]|nr:hypothetical protein [Verrucomicrobiales bacterium]